MEKKNVTISCKPYLRTYLTNLYGNPVDLVEDRPAYNYLIRLLTRKVHRNKKRTRSKGYGNKVYKSSVEILLRPQDLLFGNPQLTSPAMIEFNLFMESQLKMISRSFIATCEMHGMEQSTAIKDFQETFGFSNDDFSYDAIKLDILRNGQDCPIRRLQHKKRPSQKPKIELF